MIPARNIRLFFILPFLLIGCLQSASFTREYRVRHVIDGDTIELDNGSTVRYIGIDTPEVRKRQGNSWVYAPEPYAEKAKDYNRMLVEGKPVRLQFDVQKKDKYGRLLAYCYVDDVFVNAKMLEEGFAFLYTISPNVKYVDLLVDKQKSARQNNRGIWAEPVIIPAKDAKNYLNQMVTVEGKVSSVRQSAKVSILNFGQSGFKAVVFKGEFPFFLSQGISIPKAYKGKTLRITGKIKEYKGGPEIIVQHPSAIEVID
jgi:micrococcal nuclease